MRAPCSPRALLPLELVGRLVEHHGVVHGGRARPSRALRGAYQRIYESYLTGECSRLCVKGADLNNNVVRRVDAGLVAPVITTPPAESTTAPAAPTPAPATPLVLAPAPKFAALVTLPPARACVSRRKFRIRLRQPKGVVIVEATVRVNGKQVKVVTGRRLTAPVDLRDLPKGLFTVAVTLQTNTGETITGKRRYKTCARKRR